ncbi:MAG TPA: DUF2934 domain-containing protein [Rhodopila sp.]
MDNLGKPIEDDAVRQLIAARAYEMWENQGRPSGCDLLNWHQAEQEILSSLPNERSPAPSRARKIKSVNGSGRSKPATSLSA